MIINQEISINYIFAGNNGYIESYIYNENIIYHKYYDIDEKNKKGKDHSSIIFSIEDICKEWLRGICLWNNEYLFVGCDDKIIKLIDLNTNIIIKELIKVNRDMLTVKKIYHYKFGECLISQVGKMNK